MSKKFIPTGDSAFANMAKAFAGTIARDPAKYQVSGEELELLQKLVADYRTALAAAIWKPTRTQIGVHRKNDARKMAKQKIEAIGAAIRANESLSSADKLAVHVFERPKKLRRTKCPQWAPLLYFRGARNEGSVTGRQHVLEFYDPGRQTFPLQQLMPKCGKPAGAARVELFMELVAEGEKIPSHPGELSGGRPWFLRAFARNPMIVDFPMPATAMKVVYWARWSDSSGAFGPFSQTCQATVEGFAGQGAALPDQTEARRRQQRIVITTAMKQLPDYGRGVEHVSEGVVKLLAG